MVNIGANTNAAVINTFGKWCRQRVLCSEIPTSGKWRSFLELCHAMPPYDQAKFRPDQPTDATVVRDNRWTLLYGLDFFYSLMYSLNKNSGSVLRRVSRRNEKTKTRFVAQSVSKSLTCTDDKLANNKPAGGFDVCDELKLSGSCF